MGSQRIMIKRVSTLDLADNSSQASKSHYYDEELVLGSTTL